MEHYILITIGAITSAVRFSKVLLQETGMKSSVVHTPAEINKGGCSYSVRTTKDALPYIIDVAQKYKLPMKKIYEIASNGGESEYRVIS